MTEPMSPDRLDFYEEVGRRWVSERIGSLLARAALTELTAEVRRLQDENKLLHLSRGSAPHSLVGMD